MKQKTTIDFGKMAKTKRAIRSWAYRNRDDGIGFEAKTVDTLLKIIDDTELKVLIKNSRCLFQIKNDIDKKAFWQKKQYKIK